MSCECLNAWGKCGQNEQTRIEMARDLFDKLPKADKDAERAKRSLTLYVYTELPKAAKKTTPKPTASFDPLPAKQSFIQFLNAIAQAPAIVSMDWFQVIDQAAQSDLAWATWMLKKRYPQDFGERGAEKVPTDLNVERNVVCLPALLTADNLIKVMR